MMIKQCNECEKIIEEGKGYYIGRLGKDVCSKKCLKKFVGKL